MSESSRTAVGGGSHVTEVRTQHVFQSWSAQKTFKPLPGIESAMGSYLEIGGKRYLDFTSQLVYVNMGYQHPKIVKAIVEQAQTLCTSQPAFSQDVRSEAARLIAKVAPEGLNYVFFTNSGAEANENALRMARLHTGRHKVLAAYRSYHGATAGALTLTGEPRRWPSEPGIPGVVHYFGPYLYRSFFGAQTVEEETQRALAHLRNVVECEGPSNIAGIIFETVTGTNGVIPPTPGYLAGVREICDEHGIMMIADEVMAGFARCGEWFAVNHWNVVPDLITFAKGVNSGYVPLGGVIVSDAVFESFGDRTYPGGLTYQGHLLGCAAAVASINAMKEEDAVTNARALGTSVIAPGLSALAERHLSIGEVRGLGAFWALELVRNRKTREPFVPLDAKGDAAAPMRVEFAGACRELGLWPMVVGNRVHIAPACNSTRDDVSNGIEILDKALEVADRYYTS